MMVIGRTVWLWFHGSKDTALHGTWPLSTHWQHPTSHRAQSSTVQPRQTERPPSTLSVSQLPVFFPVAVETFGTMAEEEHGFVREIGRRSTLSTADPPETAFLYQRISVAVQRFNSVCLANSFPIFESSGSPFQTFFTTLLNVYALGTK